MTLSQKCCRVRHGTKSIVAHVQLQLAQLCPVVFKWRLESSGFISRLNAVNDEGVLADAGRAFQARAAATGNARLRSVVCHVGGIIGSVDVDPERIRRHDSTVDHWWIVSAVKAGRPEHKRNCIKLKNEWCYMFRSPDSSDNRAAALNTDCSRHWVCSWRSDRHWVAIIQLTSARINLHVTHNVYMSGCKTWSDSCNQLDVSIQVDSKRPWQINGELYFRCRVVSVD